MEERNTSFSGYSPGKQSFASAWRSHQEHSFWELATKGLELFRVSQELDNVFQLLLGLVNLEQHMLSK